MPVADPIRRLERASNRRPPLELEINDDPNLSSGPHSFRVFTLPGGERRHYDKASALVGVQARWDQAMETSKALAICGVVPELGHKLKVTVHIPAVPITILQSP